MYNNDYSVFPKTAENGDTYQFRGRTYVYDSAMDAWADSLIPRPIDPTQYTSEYRNPSEGMSTVIFSRPEDIAADVKYLRLVEAKNNKLTEVDFYIERYSERKLMKIQQTESLNDILNYKAAIEAIGDSADIDTLEWPPVPWVTS